MNFDTGGPPPNGAPACFTCESCLSIDAREWHRQGLLTHTGLLFTWSWTRGGEPSGSIDVRIAANAVVLTFKGSSDWKSIEQRVPVTWTRCHLGSVRPWFRCTASVDGRLCEQRVAILYRCGAPVFQCRQCCGLTYASQREVPRHRAIRRAQKLRMHLGGSANLSDPFPKRPRGMHRRTYHKLLARAMAVQERSIGLEIEYLHRRYPGLLSKDDSTVGAVRGRK